MGSPDVEISLRDRVRQQILDLIQRMDLNYSTRLLPEGQLAAKFQVSRSTVRAVLSDLEVEGKVIRKQGSGTYVNVRTIHVNTTLYPRMDLRSIILNNGYDARSKVLSIRTVPAGAMAAKLNCGQNHPVQEVCTMYYADGRPCMYCIDCIRDGRVSPGQWRDPGLEVRSIYDFLRETAGIHVKWDLMRIRAVTSGEVPELAAQFDIPVGRVRAFTLLEILNYDEENRPVLLGNIYADTEMIRLNLIRDLG